MFQILIVEDDKELYFNCSNEIEQLQQKKTISLIGTLKINKYLNTESINMIIEDMK